LRIDPTCDVSRDLLFDALAPILEERIEGSHQLQLRRLEGGASNRTWALEWGTSRYVLRAPPRGSAVITHDARREFRALKAVAEVFSLAPRPLHLVRDPAATGTPFFVMEWRAGRRLDDLQPPGGEHGALAAASTFMACLADLHALDAGAPGLRDLGAPAGFVERLVQGLHRRWTSSAEDDADASAIAAWLSARIPKPQRAAVLHNDFKPDNVLWNDPLDAIAAVVDWELCSLGDPLVDLGLVLAYWPDEHDDEDRRSIDVVPLRPGLPTRRRLLDAYAARSHLRVDAVAFYEVLGLFKVAVLMQQIVARDEGAAAARFRGAPARVLRAARRVAGA